MSRGLGDVYKRQLHEGAVVTTSRNDVDYVVTEYGIAWLRGLTVEERAKELIKIAHPDFREELTKAVEEYELFDEVSNDISDKYACKEVLTMWAAFRRSGRIPEGDAIRFRTRFAPYFAEFTSDEHPADGQYLEDIESERPSVQAQARELWLRTENLWTLFPDFIAALRR